MEKRLEMGKHCLQWLEEQDERVKKAALKTYATEVLECPADQEVPKYVKQKIYRCYKAYEDSLEHAHEYEGNVTWRRMRKGNQGRPVQSPELNRLLFQWFVNYRRIVKGRLWPRTVLKEALRIRSRLLDWYRDNNKVAPVMPALDLGKKGKRWLRGWKKRHSITFKKCARKFKVSNDKLKRRTKCTWLNSWGAMLIYNLLFGEQRTKKANCDGRISTLATKRE